MLDIDTDAVDYSFGPTEYEENVSVSNLLQKLSINQKFKDYLSLHMTVRSLTKNVNKIENLPAISDAVKTITYKTNPL